MADSLDSLRHAVAGRYTIERELGRGGNAVVYLAHDVKHDRKVALKVLSPELALAVRAERFLREIQIAAKLTHPHILPLYDSGQAGATLFYVMPYVEGDSLRDRLNRERQLPIDVALGIARDVAQALGEAHHQGIIHRDIKPENILLLKTGEALVADFGIARALTVAGGQQVTEGGIAVGTPAYMSPEQATGGDTVDARSDIYSLACVVYEMIAGRPPFVGATAQETLARHALDPVPTVRAARSGVPPSVEHALARAMAKQPADRFAMPSQFIEALGASEATSRPRRTVAWAGLGALALAVTAAGWLAFRPAPPTSPPTQSVAVLPFLPLSAEAEFEYFSDGMSEELINALSQVPGLRVPARTSSFAFRGSTDIREIGRRLGVAHVLEGSLRRTGDILRVHAELIKVADGYHVWARSFTRELRSAADVFAVQDEIVRAIVIALQLSLPPPEPGAVTTRRTDDVEALQFYLRGRYFAARGALPDVRKAIDQFRLAIRKDSGFAEAHSGLADAYTVGIASLAQAYPAGENWPRADSAARRAIALNESLAEAHTSMARVLESWQRDYPAAEREYLRALTLNPQYALAHLWYGRFLAVSVGERYEDAVAQARLGLSLDPLSSRMNQEAGLVFLAASQYDSAVSHLKVAIDLAPDYHSAWRTLGEVYIAQHKFSEALETFERQMSVARDPGPRDSAGLAYGYAVTGNRAEALKILNQLLASSRTRNVWQNLAIVYAGLGDNDLAFDALERARLSGDYAAPRIKANRLWEPLHGDPRWKQLLQRLGYNQ